MPDVRNSSESYNSLWDNCLHDWIEVESMSYTEVKCKKCDVSGDRIDEDSVYWPAT